MKFYSPEEIKMLMGCESSAWYHEYLRMDEPWVRDTLDAIKHSRAIVIEDTSSRSNIDDIVVTTIIEHAQSRYARALVDSYFRQEIRNIMSECNLPKEITSRITFFDTTSQHHYDEKLLGAKPSLFVLMSIRSGRTDEGRIANRVLRLKQSQPQSQFIICGDIRVPTVLTKDLTRDWDRIAVMQGSEHELLSDPAIRARFSG